MNFWDELFSTAASVIIIISSTSAYPELNLGVLYKMVPLRVRGLSVGSL